MSVLADAEARLQALQKNRVDCGRPCRRPQTSPEGSGRPSHHGRQLGGCPTCSTRRTAVSVEWPGLKPDCNSGRRSADVRYSSAGWRRGAPGQVRNRSVWAGVGSIYRVLVSSQQGWRTPLWRQQELGQLCYGAKYAIFGAIGQRRSRFSRIDRIRAVTRRLKEATFWRHPYAHPYHSTSRGLFWFVNVLTALSA